MSTIKDKATANIEICKGQDKGAILLGWEIAETSDEVIAEIADHIGIESSEVDDLKKAVAEALSEM